MSKAKKSKGLGATPQVGDRRCIFNPRTKQRRPQEWKKTARFKNGAWQFVKGGCD